MAVPQTSSSKFRAFNLGSQQMIIEFSNLEHGQKLIHILINKHIHC